MVIKLEEDGNVRTKAHRATNVLGLSIFFFIGLTIASFLADIIIAWAYGEKVNLYEEFGKSFRLSRLVISLVIAILQGFIIDKYAFRSKTVKN